MSKHAWKPMRRCRLFAGAIALIPFAAMANTPSIVVVARSGTCLKMVIEGRAMPCGGTLFDTLSNHSRQGFTFQIGSDLATFSGADGPHFPNPLTEVWRIDTFHAVSIGERPVDGFCSYSLHPPVAVIACKVESDYGIITAQFTTDGTPPKPVAVEHPHLRRGDD